MLPPPSMSVPQSLPLPPNRSPLHFPNSRRTRIANLQNHGDHNSDISPTTVPVGSSFRALDRDGSLHHLLGGGAFADVVLWRRRSVSAGILTGVVAAWTVFHVFHYTLLSFSSNVMLLLLSLLFLWAKAAAVLNRPPPPIPHVQISKETMNEAAAAFRSHINTALLGFNSIAQAKDWKLYYKVSICLALVSLIGRLTDIITLTYLSLVIVLTVPALYEKYQDFVDEELEAYQRRYASHLSKYCNKVRSWCIGKAKLT